MGYSLYPIFFYLRGIIRNKKMATTLHFNITTKKVKVNQTVSQDLYGIITGPSGVAFVTKNSIGNELIDGDTESIYFNLPLDTSNNIVYGTYTLKYYTEEFNPNNPATYDSVSFTYLGADTLTACFTVEHNCDYYPTGLIMATDSTYYGSNDGTATSPEILSRTLSLYYPDGLVDPTPAVNPAVGEQDPITTGAYTLTVDTLATGMWTAIMDVQLLYTQEDDLVIEYQLKKTLNHNVACVGQLCSINGCIDGMTQAYNSDVACGVTTPRYAKQLTLINAYFSQYQMERACGNTAKANEYLNLMNELVSGTSTCSCSSGSCSGSCGSSCSCDSCGDDNTPRWINTPGSTTQSILEQIQSNITNIEEDIVQLQDEDTDIWNAIEDIQPAYKVYTALLTTLSNDDPTAVVLENTLSGPVVWTRSAEGVYIGTLSSAFVTDKTFVFIGTYSISNGNVWFIKYNLTSTNSITINCYDEGQNLIDGLGVNVPIEIRVYN